MGGVEFARYEYFSQWYVAALHAALSTDFKRRSTEEMAEALHISPIEVLQGLESLKALKLIEKQDGFWTSAPVLLETPRETKSLLIRNFHKQMMSRAMASLNELEDKDRNAQAVTLVLTELEYRDLVDRANHFRENISRIYKGSDEETGVYQINLQIFPLVKKMGASS